MIAARYSSAMRPRFSKGTPSKSNSSFSQPTPKVTMILPLLIQSSVESALAAIIGFCSGNSAIELLIRMRLVAPAK